jgi:TolA-binding protein
MAETNEGNGKGRNWAQLGAGVGAALSILGAAFASFSSGGARQSAQSAQAAERQVIITQEMMERGRARAAEIEHRITLLKEDMTSLRQKVQELEQEIATDHEGGKF